MSLNGWQRLWVLLISIYFILVVSVAFAFDPPSKQKVYQSWLSSMTNWVINNDSKFKNQYPWDVAKTFPDMSTKEMIDAIQAKYTKDNKFHKFDFININTKYQSKLDRVTSEQVQYFGVVLLIWLIPSVFIYLLGWGISWVRHGFKKS